MCKENQEILYTNPCSHHYTSFAMFTFKMHTQNKRRNQPISRGQALEIEKPALEGSFSVLWKDLPVKPLFLYLSFFSGAC